MATETEPATPPGEPVRWETIQREYDRDNRLITEKVTVTTETVTDFKPPPAEARNGFYL